MVPTAGDTVPMTVLLHRLNASTRLSWGISPTAELGALLAADLRAQRKVDSAGGLGQLEKFRGLYKWVRSLLFYIGTFDDNADGETAALPIARLSDSEFERITELTVASVDRDLADRIHSNIHDVRTHLDAFLDLYVESRFIEHWNRARPQLQHHVEAAKEAWRARGSAEAVASYIGAAHLGGSRGSVLIEKLYGLTVDTARRPVRLIPTVLNWPQVLIKDEDDTVQIHYSIAPPGARPLVSSTQVTAQMAALSRQHSLTILREIAKRPVGTMGIADRLGIAPATVSRTLHELISTSLITSHPHGRQRLYRLNVDEFEALGKNVWQVIVR